MQDRDNFQWRPNDTSSRTNLKYQLEADHWLKAIKGSEHSKPSGSMLGDIGNMFLVISFLLNIIELIFMGLWAIIKWVIKLFRKPEPIVTRPIEREPRGPRTFTSEEITEMYNTPCETLKNPWEDENWNKD